MISAKLGETEAAPRPGLSLNDLGDLQRMPADLDRAVTLRQHHWQVLGALLTERRAGLPAARRAARPLTSPRPVPPRPLRRNSIMDRPAIVIRDIHRYGDDLTVPEAIARLCGGGPVTVTVTDPAPPGGDPRGNPRHGSGITVRPALGGQPELPPEISWDARTFEAPAAAALFAEALALATRPPPGAASAPAGAGRAASMPPTAAPTPRRSAWAEVRAQLSHGQPQPAGGITGEAPGPARGSDHLYRVVQYYDSWPFHHDSRVPRGSKSRRRTDTFRTLGPVRDRLARANGDARYQRGNGGDRAAFVAAAEQLTDDGWQPIDVDLR